MPDLALFLIVTAAIISRYADIVLFSGKTAAGEPATLAQGHRYALVMALGSAGIWALARWIASRG